MPTTPSSIQGRQTFRSGLTRQQLIVVACSLVIAVSVVSIILFIRSLGPKEYYGDWQCLQCDHTFSSTTLRPAPIDCPKCPGQAVRLTRQTCPKCGKRVVVSRVRLTEQGQALHDQILAQQEAGAFRGIYSMAVAELPVEVQYRIKLPSGGYGWSEEWYPAATPDDFFPPEPVECDKCGTRIPAPAR